MRTLTGVTLRLLLAGVQGYAAWALASQAAPAAPGWLIDMLVVGGVLAAASAALRAVPEAPMSHPKRLEARTRTRP